MNFSILEPFNIDNGELNGIEPQTIFTLGVEWQMFYQKLQAGDSFLMQVHKENVGRLKVLCIRNKRKFEVTIIKDYDDWKTFEVI